MRRVIFALVILAATTVLACDDFCVAMKKVISERADQFSSIKGKQLGDSPPIWDATVPIPGTQMSLITKRSKEERLVFSGVSDEIPTADARNQFKNLQDELAAMISESSNGWYTKPRTTADFDSIDFFDRDGHWLGWIELRASPNDPGKSMVDISIVSE